MVNKKNISFLIISGFVIFIVVVIILIDNFGNSETYRERNTAKRKLEEFGLNYVKWGDEIHLQNQNITVTGDKTYLDVCGRCGTGTKCTGCSGGTNLSDVSTNPTSSRDNKSGTWKFDIITTEQAFRDNPDYIIYGDIVHVHSLAGGYLDACGFCGDNDKRCACLYNQNVYDVIVNSDPERDERGTGTWKIISAIGIPEGKFIEYGADIYLENQLIDETRKLGPTFLDVCGKCDRGGRGRKCAGSSCVRSNRGDVTTSHTPTRVEGSGTWKIEKADG